MSETTHRLQTPRGDLPYLSVRSALGAEAPLVVFLHGARDRGNNLSKLTAWGFPKAASALENPPYHWLALQIPEGTTWPEWQEELFGLIDLLHPDRGTNRFVLTGFSLGAAGAWHIAAANPDRISALVPVSGRLPDSVTPESLNGLGGTPVWIFHGELDDKVPVGAVIAAFESLRGQGGQARLTLIADGDHFIADKVFADPALQAWLASPRKELAAEAELAATIANP